MINSTLTRNTATWFVRITLAIAFLSAVADRFGLWGPPGAPNVAWGGWAPFLDYVAVLNPMVPPSLIPTLGGIATALEIALAVGLLVGWKLRWFALASGLLLMAFAAAMTFTMGIKAPLDYSVLSAAGAAFVLAIISSKQEAGK
jgi:hypothetical protein